MRDWPAEAVPATAVGQLWRWWKQGYRLGMTLGGLVAVDLDPAPAMYGLHLDFPELLGSPTWWQQTPRGGRHYLYSIGGSSGAYASGFKSACPWRVYPEGQVDIKTGQGAYVVLYGPPGTLPRLEGVAALPERLAQAMPRAEASELRPSLGWDELVEKTKHYRTSDRVLQLLCKDRREIAATAPGQQSSQLNGKAFSWGKSVRKGFCSATTAEGLLVLGGMGMANASGREAWTQEQVRDVVRRGLAAGHAAGANVRFENGAP
jgi:hypothetical protein